MQKQAAEHQQALLQQRQMMQQQQQALQQQLAMMQQNKIEQEARNDELRKQLAAKGDKDGASGMEPKGLKMPKEFYNEETKWPDFAFKLENWLAGFVPEAREFLAWAELQDGEQDHLLELAEEVLAHRTQVLISWWTQLIDSAQSATAGAPTITNPASSGSQRGKAG